jgi:phage gp29-like protein
MNIIKPVMNFFKKPARITIVNSKYEPESFIEWADVDRVGMAIRSAKGGATQPLFALYRDIVLTDSHIQTEIAKRKGAVLGDQFRVIPYDKKVPADVETAKFIEQQINAVPGWLKSLADLLDGFLWPVAVAEKIFVPSRSGFQLVELAQVPQFLFDYSDGYLKIRETKETGEPGDNCFDPDPNRYIVHRGHMLSSPDHFGGPMRSLIYWWLASVMTRDWWVRFLERFGAPFIVGKYDTSNPNDKAICLAAMRQATRTFGIVVSRDTEIEIQEATQASGDAFGAFQAIAQREKSKLIVGQTLSTQTDSTGMGSGVANLQGDVREDLRKLDATMLAATIRDQLIKQICSINRLPGRPPYIMWGTGASNADKKALAEIFYPLRAAGLEPDDSAIEVLSDEIGFSLRRAPQMQIGGAPGLNQFSAPQEVGATTFFRHERLGRLTSV